MVIGDRLRTLRETKISRRVKSKSARGFCDATSVASKTGTRFRPLIHLKNWRGLLEIPMYQLFYNGDKPPKAPNLPRSNITVTLIGAVQARMLKC